MPSHVRILVIVVVALVASFAVQRAAPVSGVGGAPNTSGAGWALDEATSERIGAPLLGDDLRAASFRFAPDVAALDRQAFLDAIAVARPEAQRLVALVDGLIDVSFHAIGGGAVGQTSGGGDQIEVVVDMGGVYANHGKRGVSRVVLHELAHAIDRALLTDELVKQLDAGIPPGWPCDAGQPEGSCEALQERFAESFAKWATGDIGLDLYLGYKVPPPPLLEQWGAPLAQSGA